MSKTQQKKSVVRIVDVDLYGPGQLYLTLSRGAGVIRDFRRVATKGVLKRLNDQKFFARVKVKDGILTWPGEIDFSPERVLYGCCPVTSSRIPAVMVL